MESKQRSDTTKYVEIHFQPPGTFCWFRHTFSQLMEVPVKWATPPYKLYFLSPVAVILDLLTLYSACKCPRRDNQNTGSIWLNLPVKGPFKIISKLLVFVSCLNQTFCFGGKFWYNTRAGNPGFEICTAAHFAGTVIGDPPPFYCSGYL